MFTMVDSWRQVDTNTDTNKQVECKRTEWNNLKQKRAVKALCALTAWYSKKLFETI